MLHAYRGNHLGSRLYQYAFGQSAFVAYLFAYLLFAYQIVSLLLNLRIEVTRPVVTLGALTDSAFADAVL